MVFIEMYYECTCCKKLHLSLQYTVSIFHQLTENLIEAGILMISQHYAPLACAVNVGQICQFEQLFVYELPWQRSSKNVREPFRRHNWAPSTVTPTAKSHSIYGLIKLIAVDHWGLWNKESAEGGRLYGLLDTTRVFSINGLGAQSQSAVRCIHKHHSSFLLPSATL